MAVPFDGIHILRVVSMADMRLGHEGQIATALIFTVDGDGPFGFEVDRTRFAPSEVLARIHETARQVRALRIGSPP
jgi:hypothetical protein